MKKLFVLLLVAVMTAISLTAVVGCSDKTDLETVKKKGVLRVGITVYEPMDYYNEDETDFIGFDADLSRAFAKELGVEVKFVLITWSQKVLELKNGEIDCIWNGMTASEELGKEIDLSVAYATNMQCVVAKKENAANYNGIDDVKAAKIAVEQGSAANTVCNTVLNLDASKLNAVTAQVDALTEVKSNASDLAMIDYTMAYSVVGKGEFADLQIVDVNKVSFDKEEFAIGFRKGSDLTAKADAFLKKAYQDGTMAELLTKYEGVALNENALK